MSSSEFIHWFRQASPYIHTHRGSTVVLSFDGQFIEGPGFNNLVHDIALLSALGIRVILVPGCRPQAERRLEQRGLRMQLVDGIRVTDLDALTCVKEAAGVVRVEIEALLSTGLANTPMAGARLRVDSGNYVTAKPIGVINGTDFLYTGCVRRVDIAAINQRLDTGAIVLISPLGYSPTGEVFNMRASEMAAKVAIAIEADKLVFLSDQVVRDAKRMPVNAIHPEQLKTLAEKNLKRHAAHQELFQGALLAAQGGVSRVHLIPARQDGALLLEMFTRDGVGTLITSLPYQSIRQATIEDVIGILELINPLEDAGYLVKRSKERLENDIDKFSVIERDGTIIACAGLYTFARQKSAELACLAVHPQYQGMGVGKAILDFVENLARENDIPSLFVLTTRAPAWFKQHGFIPGDIRLLPKQRKQLYNWQRNSNILVKST